MTRILLLTAILALCAASALPQTARRKGSLRLEKAEAAPEAVHADTVIAPDASQVRLSGYDKPLNARYETLLVTNLTGSDTIASLGLRMHYFDTFGREFHLEDRAVDADIPPGATRKVDFPSWDRQGTFYYVLGRRPRRLEGVCPFDISVEVLWYAK